MNLKSVKITGLIILGIFFILIWVSVFFNQGKKGIEAEPVEENQKENEVIRPEENKGAIDYSLEKSETGKLPVAVVIDNFSESWPLAGINMAAVVYEAPVEADITRLLAVFNQDFLPDKIGPVRSARPYLAEWAEEYGSLFIHAGGSQDFLEKIKTGEYQFYNLDEIGYNGVYFWRDDLRDKPHNLYIHGKSIEKLIEDKRIDNQLKPNFIPRQFNETPVLNETAANLIVKINYREPVVWQFDKASENYLRFQNGRSFVDENGVQTKTANLIVQKTEIRILDEIGHRFIETLGQGDALIFQNGALTQGIWRKSDKTGQTVFYDLQGQEIKFLPGNVWVEIVSLDHQVLY